MTPKQEKIMDCIAEQPKTPQQIAREIALPLNVVLMLLGILVKTGDVKQNKLHFEAAENPPEEDFSPNVQWRPSKTLFLQDLWKSEIRHDRESRACTNTA